MFWMAKRRLIEVELGYLNTPIVEKIVETGLTATLTVTDDYGATGTKTMTL